MWYNNINKIKLFLVEKQQIKGFTLLELLIVIAIIAVLSAIIFVAIDPMTRFRDSRDAARWTDAAELLHAIKIDQVDNNGSYASAINNLINDEIYLIGTDVADCDTQDSLGTVVTCTAPVTQAGCANLTSGADNLVSEGYISSIPVSPNSTTNRWGSNKTGYTIEKEASGLIWIRACQEEGSAAIETGR